MSCKRETINCSFCYVLTVPKASADLSCKVMTVIGKINPVRLWQTQEILLQCAGAPRVVCRLVILDVFCWWSISNVYKLPDSMPSDSPISRLMGPSEDEGSTHDALNGLG